MGKNSAAQMTLGRRELVLMLAALMSMNALAIDIMLPALDRIAGDFGVTSPNDRQYVISAFILGMASGTIFYGNLADRFGRKRVLLGSLCLYTIFSLMCVLAPDYQLFLLARLAQGLASAAMAVMVNAIVRDLYSGDAMASLMSTVSMLFMVVPVIAPSLGQFILFFGEWQLIFVVLFAAGAAMLGWVGLRLPETLDAEDIRPISLAAIARTWGHILGHRGAMGHVLGSGIAMGGLFGFLTSSQQIFVETFGQGERFALWFAVIVSLMALTNFTNSRIVERFGARRVSQSAMFALVGFSGSLLIITLAGGLSLPIFVILLAPALATIGFTGANFQSIAMEDFGHEAGTASSLQSFIRMTLGVVIGASIGLSYDGSVLPMLYGLLSCGLISIVIIGWAEHWRYFQRPRKLRPPLG